MNTDKIDRHIIYDPIDLYKPYTVIFRPQVSKDLTIRKFTNRWEAEELVIKLRELSAPLSGEPINPKKDMSVFTKIEDGVYYDGWSTFRAVIKYPNTKPKMYFAKTLGEARLAITRRQKFDKHLVQSLVRKKIPDSKTNRKIARLKSSMLG